MSGASVYGGDEMARKVAKQMFQLSVKQYVFPQIKYFAKDDTHKLLGKCAILALWLKGKEKDCVDGEEEVSKQTRASWYEEWNNNYEMVWDIIKRARNGAIKEIRKNWFSK